MADYIQRVDSLAAADAATSDLFGAVAISGDGLVLAVGAEGWEGSLSGQGGVYIYDWSGSAWVQRGAVLTPADAGASDAFGTAVCLSDDGSVLFVGARLWDGGVSNSGAVYCFDWTGASWSQRGAVIGASDAGAGDNFGCALACSATGAVLAVGANLWDILSDQGVIYIFDWTGAAFAQRQIVTSPAPLAFEKFGKGVALSADGTLLAAAAPVGDSVGDVYVFDWDGVDFVARPIVLRASDPLHENGFGTGIGMSAGGEMLAVGAVSRGVVYIFDAEGAGYVQREIAAVDLGTSLLGANFGEFVSVTADGTVIACGGPLFSTGRGRVVFFDGPPVAGPAGPTVLSVIVTTDRAVPAAILATKIIGPVEVAAAQLPVTVLAPDPADFTGAEVRWQPSLILGGVDLSDQLRDEGAVDAREDASTLFDFAFVPGAGAIVPEAYENQPVIFDVLAVDAAGVELSRARVFTGTVSVARYEPDTGLLQVTATTDLQGRYDRTPKAAIDTIVAGSWSPHVFDASADGYQYALDRLSTRPAETHVDATGQLVVVDWAAKATADIELTDAGRFGNSLRLERASRSDLVTVYRAALDFRYARLRHRDIRVQLIGRSLCDYLDNGYQLPPKEAVRQAADGSAWTRTSEITFQDLPGPIAAVCTPQRAWAGGAEDFCLGASWSAARRWAQTLTEVYALEMTAPDLVERVGTLPIEESYGIEATHDATDYENVTDFVAPPAAAVFQSATNDWELAATEAEFDGRAAMAVAQTAILARGRALILGRARRNRLSLSAPWRPDLSLESTVRVNTPHLVAKGKVAALLQRFGFSGPGAGRLSMELSLALSRHGGSGLAVDDPTTPADAPALPAEATTPRVYAVAYRLGGTLSSPADDEEWDGWMTNVDPLIQAPGANLYRTRLVLRMPEIETTARDAATVETAQAYTVAVPQDELTMSN